MRVKAACVSQILTWRALLSSIISIYMTTWMISILNAFSKVPSIKIPNQSNWGGGGEGVNGNSFEIRKFIGCYNECLR